MENLNFWLVINAIQAHNEETEGKRLDLYGLCDALQNRELLNNLGFSGKEYDAIIDRALTEVITDILSEEQSACN